MINEVGSESSPQAGAVMSCLITFSKNLSVIVSDISTQDLLFGNQDNLGKYYFFSLYFFPFPFPQV